MLSGSLPLLLCNKAGHFVPVSDPSELQHSSAVPATHAEEHSLASPYGREALMSVPSGTC